LDGITVLTGLSRALVAAHFLAAMVLVSLSAYLLYRVSGGDELSGLSLAFCGRR
jgi:heme A synthase